MADHISVIIPVYGEGAIIDQAIQRLRDSADGESVEAIVADGGPGHTTLAAMNDRQAVRVRCPAGRAVQMNAGAAMATGSILLFLHADTRLPHGWPEQVRTGLGRARAGAFSLAFDSTRPALKLVARFANLRTSLERIPYGDQAPFMEAALFRELGGFADIPIMEDVEFFSRLKRRGERIVLLKERAETSPRRYEKDGIVRRVLSNWNLRLRYALGAPPETLIRDYRPHENDGDLR